MGNLIVGPWPPVNEPTLSMATFSRHHCVTPTTVRRWIREGMPCDRDLDGKPWFSLPLTDAWLEERSAA